MVSFNQTYVVRQPNRLIDSSAQKQTDKQKVRQTDRKTARQTVK